MNEVIEYTVSTTYDWDFFWSATCEEDEVSEDCEFWAYLGILEEDAVEYVIAIESTANSDDAYNICEGGEDQVEAGNCEADGTTANKAICTFKIDSTEGSGFGYYFYLDLVYEPEGRRSLVAADAARSTFTDSDWGSSVTCSENSGDDASGIFINALLAVSFA